MDIAITALWLLLDNAEAVFLSCCFCWGLTFCITMMFVTAFVATWRKR